MDPVEFTCPDDGRPRVRVQVQVTMPAELGGRKVDEAVELPVDSWSPSQGKGVSAMIDCAVHHAKAQLLKPQ